jgi:microcystin-dependent protein
VAGAVDHERLVPRAVHAPAVALAPNDQPTFTLTALHLQGVHLRQGGHYRSDRHLSFQDGLEMTLTLIWLTGRLMPDFKTMQPNLGLNFIIALQGIFPSRS